MKLVVSALLVPVVSALAVNTPLEPRTLVVKSESEAPHYYHVGESVAEDRRDEDAKVGTFSKVPQPKFALNK